MEDIFKGAKFGDKFRTRNGRIAVLWYYHVGMGIIDQMVFITTGANKLLVDGKGVSYHNTDDDIVGKWEEPIDEKELDKLAEESNPNTSHGDAYEAGQYFGFDDGFKAGYLKRMEEEK